MQIISKGYQPQCHGIFDDLTSKDYFSSMWQWNHTVTLSPYLQGQVGVFLFLAHLQTRQVGILQLQIVLLSEVLSHCAFNRLTILKLQWKSVDLKVTRIT